MKRGLFGLIFSTLAITLLIDSVKADELSVNVSVYPEVIIPTQDVTVAATTNLNGVGIIFVFQPIRGSSAASSEGDVQSSLNVISSDSDASMWRIVSYVLVRISDLEGGRREFTFPDDFEGLNGEPSTSTYGRYIVFFVFANRLVRKIDFDCAIFQVVPEFPFGTLMATTAIFGALFCHVSIKRYQTKR